jgi:lariat debranching enzyme
LGNPGSEKLLHVLQPSFWFAAHLHVKFAAVVRHPPVPGSSSTTTTDNKDKPKENATSTSATTTTTSDSKEATSSSPTAPSAPPQKLTRFLALSKVMPGQDYMQVMLITISYITSHDNLVCNDNRVGH